MYNIVPSQYTGKDTEARKRKRPCPKSLTNRKQQSWGCPVPAWQSEVLSSPLPPPPPPPPPLPPLPPSISHGIGHKDVHPITRYTTSSTVLLTLLTCWAGLLACVNSWKEKLSVASSRLLESRTETKYLGPDQPVEALGRLSVGAESTGWSQVPGRPWRGDVSVFGDEDRDPECQSRADLEGQPVLVFILPLGKLRPREQTYSAPLPVPQGHTASCNRVRDGTRVFKTQRKGSGQWLRREPPPLERLSLLPWGLHRGGP